MTARISILVLAVCLLAGMASAAPSFLGTTGLIFVPNDLNLKAGDFSANFHSIDFDGVTDRIIGANVGVTENLEIGIASVNVDPDVGNDHTETILNAKYGVLEETSSRPSLMLGVLDAGGNLDEGDDPGFYAVLGKTLTPAVSSVSGSPANPIRGYLGVGGGFFDGLFAGIELGLSSKATLMAEFLSGDDSLFNFGARIALSEGIRLDLALIDSEDLGFGISYTKLGF